MKPIVIALVGEEEPESMWTWPGLAEVLEPPPDDGRELGLRLLTVEEAERDA